MERLIYNNLLYWKRREDRKPLILLGARQVGKTYILRQFGEKEFDNLVYINCHKNDFANNLFRDLEVRRIVTEIERYYDVEVKPGETFINRKTECAFFEKRIVHF